MIKAIVTGHTKGLGEGIAAALLARGIAVLGVSRSAAASPPASLVEATVDLSDGAALSAWIAGPALRDFVRGAETILLVNNAGTVQPVGALADQAPEAVLRSVTVNVAAPLALAAAVVGIKGTAACRILHISSGAGRSAMAGWSVYCATKAALDRHAEAVALDGDPSVRCVSLAPGLSIRECRVKFGRRAKRSSEFGAVIAMKNDGALQSAEATGEAIVTYLLAEAFGSVPVADIRG